MSYISIYILLYEIVLINAAVGNPGESSKSKLDFESIQLKKSHPLASELPHKPLPQNTWINNCTDCSVALAG